MPIYEYECTRCGHQLEAFQKISDEPLKSCPECHADALQKLVSAAGFQLKGTGWYATDFRNKGKPEAKNKDADSSTKTATEKSTAEKSKSDTKTDSSSTGKE